MRAQKKKCDIGAGNFFFVISVRVPKKFVISVWVKKIYCDIGAGKKQFDLCSRGQNSGLCSWSSHTPLQQTTILLGSAPPKLLCKTTKHGFTLLPLCVYNSSSHFNPTFSNNNLQPLPGPYRPSASPLPAPPPRITSLSARCVKVPPRLTKKK